MTRQRVVCPERADLCAVPAAFGDARAAPVAVCLACACTGYGRESMATTTWGTSGAPLADRADALRQTIRRKVVPVEIDLPRRPEHVLADVAITEMGSLPAVAPSGSTELTLIQT
jgi:hypothetical protein